MVEFVLNLAEKQIYPSFSHLTSHIMLPFLIILSIYLFFWSTIRLSRENQELVLKSFIAKCFLADVGDEGWITSMWMCLGPLFWNSIIQHRGIRMLYLHGSCLFVFFMMKFGLSENQHI
jgi:hypothetical protein